jgi:hypothetical protein
MAKSASVVVIWGVIWREFPLATRVGEILVVETIGALETFVPLFPEIDNLPPKNLAMTVPVAS